MMLRTGDLNLNQFGDSMKETVKRTMLQHETVFKNQVHELHRLYWTQKNLTRELYRPETEATPQSRMASCPEEGNVVSLEEVNGSFVDLSDSRHLSFNIELPAAVFTVDSVKNSIADKLLIDSEMFRPGCSANEAVIQKGGGMKNSVADKLLVSSEMFRPICRAKEAVSKEGGGMISLLDKGKNLYCYEVIDLDARVEMESHVEARGVSFNSFKVHTENCGATGSSRLDIVSDVVSSSRVQNEFVPDLNHSDTDCSERRREHKADQSGAGGSESSIAGLDVSTDSTLTQEPKSSNPALIDLNIPQDDKFSHSLNGQMLTFSSPSSSSSVVQNELWKGQVKRYPRETSPALNSDALYSVSRGKSIDWLFSDGHNSQRSKGSDFGIKEHEAANNVQGSNSTGLTECCRNSLEILSSGSNGEPPSDAKGKALSSRGFTMPVEENEDLLSGKLHGSTCSDVMQTSMARADNVMEGKEASHERSEEDTVSSHAIGRDEKQQDGLNEKVPTGSSMVDVPTRSTECTSTEKPEDEYSGTAQSGRLIVENSLEKSHGIEYKHDQDCAIFDAAEILKCISLTQSSAPWDTVTEADEGEEPMYSADSFEAMTLDMLEVRSDEHLTMPPRLIEAEDAGEGPSGVNKLRRGRGRGARDFQKDILPGMVSLSRHEICEDMHSIGYELRKNGLRRAGGGNWFVPVRSMRSRRYPVGRRN